MSVKSLSVKEAAHFLGVSEQFVRNALQQGKLPGAAIRNGKTGRYTYFIPMDALKKFVGSDKDEV